MRLARLLRAALPCAAIASAFVTPACSSSSEGTPTVQAAQLYAATDTIDGKSYTELSVAWWKWAMAIPKATNPVDGKDCSAGQSGNVWFLAGNIDGSPITRTCTIPAGKSIFFPIVNNICYACPEQEGCDTPTTAADQKACAALPTPKSISAEVDGVTVANLSGYEFTSDQFTFRGPTSDELFPCSGPVATNTCGIATGDRPGATQGYYLALKPPAKGTHTVKVKAIIPGGTASDGTPNPDWGQDVTFTITVQ
jgi:hypothetical protein